VKNRAAGHGPARTMPLADEEIETDRRPTAWVSSSGWTDRPSMEPSGGLTTS
jgi:hypothetical protein